MNVKASNVKIGVDTGGTFTDFFANINGEICHHKVLSTPKDPSRAILKGLMDLGVTPADAKIIHGSTVATNAFLERKGAKVALITTKGFEDVIEIGRQNRGDLYDLNLMEKKSLVQRSHRYGIDERMAPNGRILKKLPLKAFPSLQQKLKKGKFDSISVCLLSSYSNSKHEKKIKNTLLDLGVPITLSSEILPTYREYERFSAACINAYITPIMGRYLRNLSRTIPQGQLSIMQSNGGIISSTIAEKEAIRTLLSGPAGGVAGALEIAKRAGHKKVISFDMGGTSTDVCLMDGKIRPNAQNELDGFPIHIPMTPIQTVGAGGGSIAWVDLGGVLQVGPKSSGSVPGPACYGTGSKATVTDANLYLGRIHPDRFLGGNMKIYPRRSEKALKELGQKLGSTVKECAEGILSIANMKMGNTIRVISTQKGYDPRAFTLVSFGGAGGLHACEIAKNLGIPNVLIPRLPGVLSAFGMATCPWKKDFAKTVLIRASGRSTYQKLKKEFESLYAKAKINKEATTFEPTADLRFQGQSYELEVPFTKNFIDAFLKMHKQIYGYTHDQGTIEIVNIRLTAFGSKPRMRESSTIEKSKLQASPRPFDRRGTLRYFNREDLYSGSHLKGPAVICEDSATTFVPQNTSLSVDQQGNLILKLK